MFSAVDIIRKKRDGHVLSSDEINAFVAGAAREEWPAYQVSALLMAIVLRGMSATETASLTRAMVDSGDRLDWSDLPGVPVDKHSTGGVGDKTSLIVAPLAAACGVLVPMMSGRGLGHTGGTIDKLESIPGFRTRLDFAEMRSVMKRVGCVMIAATERIAPADRVLYRLRDVTATVESLPLITASILSKKIAEGIHGLIMDVKCGSGAFMKTRSQAEALADSLIATGKQHGLRTEALITAMDHPLGTTVGNSLEIRECIDVLRGTVHSPLRDLSVELAARMVLMGKAASTLEEARRRVQSALESGRGLEVFRAMVEAQQGDPRICDDPARLPSARHRHLLRADRSGIFQGWEAEALGRACLALGAGRQRVEEVIQPGVGAVLLIQPGQSVRSGDALVELHYDDDNRLKQALEWLRDAGPIADTKPSPSPLILDERS